MPVDYVRRVGRAHEEEVLAARQAVHAGERQACAPTGCVRGMARCRLELALQGEGSIRPY